MSRRPAGSLIEHEIAKTLEAREDLCVLTSLQKLTGGYANLVFAVNDQYILRVFFRQGWEANYEAERKALSALQMVSRVPRVLASGVLNLEWPCPYLLLTRCPGRDAFAVWPDASNSEKTVWMHGLAIAMQHTHRVSVANYGTLTDGDGAESSAPANSWQQLHDRRFADLLKAARSQPQDKTRSALVDGAESYYAIHRGTLEYQAGPRLIHGDVRLHNLIVEGSEATGLVDWEWAHGGEPEEDLVNLIRFTLFPMHEASEGAAGASREQYSDVVPLFLSAYPALRNIPQWGKRLTIHCLEADLGQLVGSERIRQNAEIRLGSWLEGLVEEAITPG